MPNLNQRSFKSFDNEWVKGTTKNPNRRDYFAHPLDRGNTPGNIVRFVCSKNLADMINRIL